jgi:hypothetical protein
VQRSAGVQILLAGNPESSSNAADISQLQKLVILIHTITPGEGDTHIPS